MAPSTNLPQLIDHPLRQLTLCREEVINQVTERTLLYSPTDPRSLEDLIEDAFFWERKRLEGKADPVRDSADNSFMKEMSQIYSLSHGRPADLRNLLEKFSRYHLDEISGHFDDGVYRLATKAVPRGFLWLFQALSWRSVREHFRDKPDLRRKLLLQGNIPQLQKLAQKGTVLLVPTHFSNLDSVLMGWSLYANGLPPFAYGAGLNLFSNPILGYFMNNLGAYKIDRRKKHALYREVLKHYSTLIIQRGCHSLFFPGGGRSRSGAIETRLKMGILGTGLSAYIENLKNHSNRPNVYIVPCVISYNFVLEASSLISDYLEEQGKGRYIATEIDESFKPKVIAQFFLKFFSQSAKTYVNFGRALDPFGHLVDDEGQSINDRGIPLNPMEFVKSGGEICHNLQRDTEYTKILADRILDRYRKENIVLASHFLAFAYFQLLKKKNQKLDIFRMMRLTEEQTRIELGEFLIYASQLLSQLQEQYRLGNCQLEPTMRSTEIQNIVETALRNIGIYHTRRPIKIIRQGTLSFICSEDVPLLFYYQNRMVNYGFQI